MADVRALLKQKRQQAAPRITHPLAQYTPNNQLQCKACNIPVKEFMWEGHVGSKKHRTAVARLREEQARAEAARAAEEAQEQENEDEYEEVDGKRRKTSEPDETPAKRQKPDNAGGFPSDFFSDPNRQLPPSTADDDGDEEGDGMQVDGPSAQQQAPAADDPLAAEYAAFMASVAQTAADAEEAHHDKYERATVFAEAQINNDALVGMPQAAEPVIAERVDEGAPPDDPEETEEQKRERIDREIIMDRLIEEERAQEEADMKVAMMKRRLEELKARKAKKKAGS